MSGSDVQALEDELTPILDTWEKARLAAADTLELG
jgi:hypothetical protein